jgi:prepilin-type processing-associated H-X9-DG protein
MYLQTFPPPPPAQEWAVYNKEDEIQGSLGPSGTWIFIDVDPDTINSGVFGSVMTSSNPATWIWKGEVPAKAHDDACSIAFVDGHVEMHRWSYPGLIPNVTYMADWDGSPVSDPDVVWLSAHTTEPAAN